MSIQSLNSLRVLNSSQVRLNSTAATNTDDSQPTKTKSALQVLLSQTRQLGSQKTVYVNQHTLELVEAKKIKVNGETIQTYSLNLGDIKSEHLENNALNLEGLNLCKMTGTFQPKVEKQLRTLVLSKNYITDISALKNLISLQKLWLDGNQITDISPLNTLTKLIWLDLGGNQISNISALNTLTNLEWLDLSGNQISDIDALKNLTSLEKLLLDGNQITQEAIEALKEALPKCDIKWDQLPVRKNTK